MLIPRIATIFLLATAATSTSACPQPVTPTFRENLHKATNIYVFRVVSLELINEDSYVSNVRGRVNVIRSLKGGAPSVLNLIYPTGLCCAPKLAVGRYYMAAVSKNTTTLELVSGDQSIVDVTDDFYHPGGAGEYGAIEPVQEFLAGQLLPSDFPGAYRLESTVSCPAMPDGT